MTVSRATQDPSADRESAASPPAMAAEAIALGLGDTAVVLWLRDGSGNWRETGRADPRDPEFAARIAELRCAAGQRAEAPSLLLLPAEQVLARTAPATALRDEASLAGWLSEEAGLALDEVMLALAPVVPGAAAPAAWGRAERICLAAHRQTVEEARAYADRWGFAAGTVSTVCARNILGEAAPAFRTPRHALVIARTEEGGPAVPETGAALAVASGTRPQGSVTAAEPVRDGDPASPPIGSGGRGSPAARDFPDVPRAGAGAVPRARARGRGLRLGAVAVALASATAIAAVLLDPSGVPPNPPGASGDAAVPGSDGVGAVTSRGLRTLAQAPEQSEPPVRSWPRTGSAGPESPVGAARQPGAAAPGDGTGASSRPDGRPPLPDLATSAPPQRPAAPPPLVRRVAAEPAYPALASFGSVPPRSEPASIAARPRPPAALGTWPARPLPPDVPRLSRPPRPSDQSVPPPVASVAAVAPRGPAAPGALVAETPSALGARALPRLPVRPPPEATVPAAREVDLPQGPGDVAVRPIALPPLSRPTPSTGTAREEPGLPIPQARPGGRLSERTEEADQERSVGVPPDARLSSRDGSAPEPAAAAAGDVSTVPLPPARPALAAADRDRSARPSAAMPTPPERPASVPARPAAVARVPSRLADPVSPRSAQSASRRSGLALSDLAVLGVFGLDSGRSCLLRLPDGRVRTARVGDTVAGWRINRIDRSAVRMSRDGRTRTVAVGASP